MKGGVVLVALLIGALALSVLAKASVKVSSIPPKFVHDSSADPSARSGSRYRQLETVPMSGGFWTLGAYFVNVDIGTPAQTFSALLDTGSSNLAVPADFCINCGTNTTIYSPSGSSTGEALAFETAECQRCSPIGSAPECVFGPAIPAPNDESSCGFGITYGGGSSALYGQIQTDVVTFGGVTVTVPFGLIENQIYFSGNSNSQNFLGILGLASDMNACNPTCVQTLYDAMVDSGAVANYFGICLTQQNGGQLDLGYVNTSRYEGYLQYVPIITQRWYNFGISDVQVGPNSIGLPPFMYATTNDVIGTFIDSGTSIILMSPAIFEYYVNAYQSNYANLKGIGEANNNFFNGACFKESEITLSDYPDLNFIAMGQNGPVTLSVPPSAYLIAAGGEVCMGVAPVTGVGMVLGDVFMSNFYIVHDRDNWTLGFAPILACD